MSQLSLIERRWRAAIDALTGRRDDLAVHFTPTADRGVEVEVLPKSWISPDAWVALSDSGLSQTRYYLRCPASEWCEMLADELKGASC